MIVYQTDAAGYYVGPTVADESPLEPGVYLIPGGCVEAPPPSAAAGQRVRWDGAAGWRVEDVPPPPPEPAPLPPDRRAEIDARLVMIDAASARPMRAILAGTADDYDRERLAALEAEAVALRAERAGL